jgi:hypothetical protein
MFIEKLKFEVHGNPNHEDEGPHTFSLAIYKNERLLMSGARWLLEYANPRLYYVAYIGDYAPEILTPVILNTLDPYYQRPQKHLLGSINLRND